MRATDSTVSQGSPLLAAPHRTLFFTGLVSLLAASAWWGLHLLARSTGTPVFALALQPAPIWAHAYLMLFAVFPTMFFGFLFTVFPRWMNGPLVTRAEYIATASLFATGTLLWLAGTFAGPPLLLLACLATGAGLLFGTVALFRVLLAAPQVVSHAVVVLVGLCVQCVALAGFAYGLASRTISRCTSRCARRCGAACCRCSSPCATAWSRSSRRAPSRATCHGDPRGSSWQWWAWPTCGCCSARQVHSQSLPFVDAAVFLLTAWCALRWTSLQARGNPLLWTLYAGFAWLPFALLLQTLRDGAFTLTGDWALGRAPIHALGMGFFGGMLVAMVTRVTMGHSGRPLRMDRITLACFVALQLGAASRVLSEVVAAPAAVQWFLLGSVALWLGAVAVWVGRVGGIYLAPRIDGKPG